MRNNNIFGSVNCRASMSYNNYAWGKKEAAVFAFSGAFQQSILNQF